MKLCDLTFEIKIYSKNQGISSHIEVDFERMVWTDKSKRLYKHGRDDPYEMLHLMMSAILNNKERIIENWEGEYVS